MSTMADYITGEQSRLTDEQIADILATAREHIEAHGWLREELIDPKTKAACGIGAIAFTQHWLSAADSGVLEEYVRDIRRITNLVLKTVGTECRLFETWNDDHAKDQQEVIDAFAKTEKNLRAGFDPDQGVQV